MTPLVERALEIALSYEGVREVSRNRGPLIDEWLRLAGLDPEKGSYAWCCAFIHACFKKSADELGFVNLFPRTAGVLKAWDRAPLWARTNMAAPGAVFVIDHGAGKGHTGMVVSVDWARERAQTIEGNTSVSGSREGDGVYRRSRKFGEINRGYLDFSKERLNA